MLCFSLVFIEKHVHTQTMFSKRLCSDFLSSYKLSLSVSFICPNVQHVHGGQQMLIFLLFWVSFLCKDEQAVSCASFCMLDKGPIKIVLSLGYIFNRLNQLRLSALVVLYIHSLKEIFYLCHRDFLLYTIFVHGHPKSISLFYINYQPWYSRVRISFLF